MRARLTLMLLLVSACGKSDEQKAAEAAAAQIQAATKQMADAIAGGAAGAAAGAGAALGAVQAAEAVDFRELKALLPEDLPGMARSNAEGEKNSAMGFTISKAEAGYDGENAANVRIVITDVGAMAGVAAMAMYAWAAGTVDRETETSYEKSTSIKGYKGYEKYDRSNTSGEVQILVGGRFVVEVNGNNVPMDVIKNAVEKVDLGKLEGMKNFGVK